MIRPWLKRNPEMASSLYFILALLFLAAAGVEGLQLAIWRSEPQKMAIAQVPLYVGAGDPWVELVGVQVDCGSVSEARVGRGQHTQVILTDQAKRVVVLATYEGTLTCADIKARPFEGTMGMLSVERRTELEEAGLLDGYGPGCSYWALCASCGPATSLTALFVEMGTAIAFLLAALWYRKRARRLERRASHRAWRYRF